MSGPLEDPIKVKVSDLEARGLESRKGKKAVLVVLVERLREQHPPPTKLFKEEGEPESRAQSTPASREDEPSQKGMSSYSSPHKDDDTAVKDKDITVREEDEDITVKEEDEDITVKEEDEDITVKEEEDEDITSKEEVEDAYNKMGHEDAPMQNLSGNKRQPDTDHEGSPPRAFSANEFAEPKQEPFKKRRGGKRQASSQQGPPDSKRYRSGSTDKHTDDDPHYDEEAVILDWYNRDLSLIIDKETFLSAKPMTSEGFAYVWHGVRARYGFLRGRLFYEVKVKDHLAVPHLEGEQHPHVVRCGWSIDDAGMMLGEEPFSYGYDGTAKASTDLKIKDYGQLFGKGDVIGCFLDMDSNPITMSFSVNGRNFGKCYKVSHRNLMGKALFPHILTKNCTFKVNFGSEHPWFQPMARYRFVGQTPLEERVLGSQELQTRQDSEIPPKHPSPPKASGKEPKRQKKVMTLHKKVARQDCEMPRKHLTPKASGKDHKRQKKVMTLDEKEALLDMLNEGKSYAAVARHYGINESTVRYIKKKEVEIRKAVSISFCGSAKKVSTVRNKSIVRMETALALWITDCCKNNIPLNSNIIRKKAQKLYQQFLTVTEGGDIQEADFLGFDDPAEKEEEEVEPSSAPKGFVASKGWFHRFQKRFHLKCASLHGEMASADTKAVAKYLETFKNIIRDKGYRPEQVFSMDDTSLFWKKMPSRTYLMKDEASASGFKAQKDRVTLIMCGNAAGFILKPGLIYRAANPRALKNKKKNLLPVFWMHNTKAWLNKVLTSNWFIQSFIPQVKDYLKDLCMEFKVLLIMDNDGGHPVDLYYEGVQLEFLPANTTSHLQPMDQGFVRAFKALYTQNSLEHLVRVMDTDSEITLKDCWHKFTIATCLGVIDRSLKDIKKETFNACWKKLWPECVHNYKSFSPEKVQHSSIDKAVHLARMLGGEGFDDITEDEIVSLIDAHSDPLTDQDLEELTKSDSEEEDMVGSGNEEKDKDLSLKRVSQIMSPAPSKSSGRDHKRQRRVARHYGINESTVRCIRKKEVEIRKAVSLSFCSSTNKVCTVREKIIGRMESALFLWITECCEKKIPLNDIIICKKARKLYHQFSTVTEGDDVQEADFLGFNKPTEEEEEEVGPSSAPEGFHASKGWLYRFQKRFHLKFVSPHGETASADTEAAMKYSETFKNIIRDKGYRPEQVFNMGETRLFWKKMPSRTYLMKDEAKSPGFKAQKDRVTLVMCSNAAGFMLKPGLIYKAANPRALKNKNKHLLPVFWMHSAKACITKILTSNWFIQSFIPQVKEYLKDLCMEFKVLLIMDNAGGHPVDLYYEGVQLEFLPPNTTSLLQPMNQGVIRAFKAIYTQNSLEHLVREMDTDSEITLKNCWHKFTIATCLCVIDRSLKDMKKETLNACWKKLWPECVHDYKGFSPEEIQHSAIDKAVQLARTLGGEGFDDITKGEIAILIDAHDDPLTNQDLEELKKSASDEEIVAGSGDEEDESLYLERLSQLKRLTKQVQESALAWDPYMERSLKFINALDTAMVPYNKAIISMKKQQQQLPITMFLERLKKDPPKPPKTPEEVLLVDKVPEEGEEVPPEM